MILLGFASVSNIILETEKETFVLVIVYRKSGPLGSFFDYFVLLINELPTQQRILIAGVGQMLPQDVAKVDSLTESLTCLNVHNIQLIYYTGKFWI